MKLADQRAILAVDPTSRGLAFAFFVFGELRDWGVRHVPGDDVATLDRILELCDADVLVIEDSGAPLCRRRVRVIRALHALYAHAINRRIGVRVVARQDVLRMWSECRRSSKDDIAEAIAQIFPVLEMVRPRKRGKYRSEDARIRIFDAVAFAVQAFRLRSDEVSPPVA